MAVFAVFVHTYICIEILKDITYQAASRALPNNKASLGACLPKRTSVRSASSCSSCSVGRQTAKYLLWSLEFGLLRYAAFLLFAFLISALIVIAWKAYAVSTCLKVAQRLIVSSANYIWQEKAHAKLHKQFNSLRSDPLIVIFHKSWLLITSLKCYLTCSLREDPGLYIVFLIIGPDSKKGGCNSGFSIKSTADILFSRSWYCSSHNLNHSRSHTCHCRKLSGDWLTAIMLTPEKINSLEMQISQKHFGKSKCYLRHGKCVCSGAT